MITTKKVDITENGYDDISFNDFKETLGTEVVDSMKNISIYYIIEK